MVKMRAAWPLLVALALMTVPQVPAQEPFEQCGDIQLVFRNPDLQRQSDGNVHAGGSLFAQFQAIGENADDISFFGFSFGPAQSPVEDDSGVCDLPPEAWFTGAYILNYRADTNPDDGFFINLQTDLVPDGTYTAAVHAYNDANEELARAWTNAIVDNCDAEGPVPPARCEGDSAQIANNEKTGPWPIVLPGDGDLDAVDSKPDGATLTVEFAEELDSFAFFMNGRDETANMTAYDGRLWDDDLLPGYGPNGLGAILVPECSQQPPQECNTLGEAYYYSARPIVDADVVRIEATDKAGNSIVKEIHIGSGQAGAITGDLPNLEITLDAPSQTINPGDSAVFKFSMTNTGGTTGHPRNGIDIPDGWEGTWSPPHQPTPPGETKLQELSVRPPAGAATGTYNINATISYDKANKAVDQTWNLRVNVGSAGAVQGNGTAGPEGEGEPAEESPGIGVAVLLLAAVAVAIVRRRA